jgi:acetyl esterase
MKTLALSLTFLLIACAGSQTPSKALSAKEIMVYKKIEGKKDLSLHIFNPKGHRSSDKKPCIVFFFGGGWSGGTPEQFYPQSEYLAKRGMVAVAAEYRTRKSHGVVPKFCVMDGKSAIRYVRLHAAELGIDPNKIAAGGGSAGGHVAAATATLTKFDETSEDKNISSKPNALVLFNPVYDNSEKGYGYSRVKEYWKDFSPMHNIKKGMAPTIVFLGSQDKLIPVATAEKFKTKMQAVGSRSELFVYKDQPHGFFNQKKSDGKYYKLTVEEMDKFLTSLGYLPKK